MPAWWQAPTLTGKARGEKSNPESSVAHQALTSPPAGFHQPGLWVVHLGGFICAITEDVFLHLDYKGSRSLQCSGLLQINPPLPLFLCIPLSNSIYKFYRWLFGKQKGMDGFLCHFVSNLYFAYSQFFDLGKYKKRRPHCLSVPCPSPRGARTLPMP